MPSKSSELTYWFGFDRSVPAPYDQLKRRETKATHISKYNQMNKTKTSTLSGPFLKALDVYYYLTVNEKNRGALGFGQNGFAAEYVSSTGAQHAAWYNAVSGDLKIGVRKAGETVLSPYDKNEKVYDTLTQNGIDVERAIECASWVELAEYGESYNEEDFDVYVSEE